MVSRTRGGAIWIVSTGLLCSPLALAQEKKDPPAATRPAAEKAAPAKGAADKPAAKHEK